MPSLFKHCRVASEVDACRKKQKAFFPFYGMGDTPKPHIVLSFGAKDLESLNKELTDKVAPFREGLHKLTLL